MQDVTRPGALPHVNGNPPGGRPECQDCVTARPEQGGYGNLHYGPCTRVPGTTILDLEPILRKEGIDVAYV